MAPHEPQVGETIALHVDARDRRALVASSAQHGSFFLYRYKQTALAVDVVIFHEAESGPEVLLIRRKFDPFQGSWAFCGGFVDLELDETPEDAAIRELKEETNVDAVLAGTEGAANAPVIEQVITKGNAQRDPRGYTVSIVFVAKVPSRELRQRAGDDAAEVGWHSLTNLPSLAFDHAEILPVAAGKVGIVMPSTG